MATEVTTQMRQVVSSSVDRLPKQQSSENVKRLDKVSEVRQELPVTEQSVSPSKDGMQINEHQANLKIEQAVEDLNSYVQNVRRELHFSIDEQSGHTIIKVIDSESQKVVRQIPPQEVVDMAKYLDSHAGILMRAKV